MYLDMQAANTLKKTEGNVALVVCNASKGKDTEDSNKDGSSKEKTKDEPKKEPEKPSQFISFFLYILLL